MKFTFGVKEFSRTPTASEKELINETIAYFMDKIREHEKFLDARIHAMNSGSHKHFKLIRTIQDCYEELNDLYEDEDKSFGEGDDWTDDVIELKDEIIRLKKENSYLKEQKANEFVLKPLYSRLEQLIDEELKELKIIPNSSLYTYKEKFKSIVAHLKKQKDQPAFTQLTAGHKTLQDSIMEQCEKLNKVQTEYAFGNENTYMQTVEKMADAFIKMQADYDAMAIKEMTNRFSHEQYLSIRNAFKKECERLNKAQDDRVFGKEDSYAQDIEKIVTYCLDLKSKTKVLYLNTNNLMSLRREIALMCHQLNEARVSSDFGNETSSEKDLQKIANSYKEILEENKKLKQKQRPLWF